uniref:Uncharacterized protein n=1 Tax=Anguilla anguilla TaxID=7936 RepID=A0A0E9W7H3_ANGAN
MRKETVLNSRSVSPRVAQNGAL